ncbi:hypothetical protein P4O66_018360, partial [Electrophorus voltai]
VLQEKYRGWQNHSMVHYFNGFASLCFERFGNCVKHWITFSNPWRDIKKGEHAPGLKHRGTAAYRAAHNIIKVRQHIPVHIVTFAFVTFSRYSYPEHMPRFGININQWQSKQNGVVGISLSGDWGEPVDITSKKDIEAAERYVQFYMGWFATPTFHRDYPQVMKDFITQYGNPKIYITENGVSEMMMCTELCDDWRIQYYKDYINEMLKGKALAKVPPQHQDGVAVKGYTAWSLLDMCEWDEGYYESSGLYYVDFRNKNKSHYPKASVQYYKRIINSSGFPNQREVENWRREATETCTSSNQILAAEEQQRTAASILRLIYYPLTSHMEMVTEIVLPTICVLCILMMAVVLMLLFTRCNEHV